MIVEIDIPSRLAQDRNHAFFIKRFFELLELLDDLIFFRFEHQIEPAQHDEGQNHIPILVRLERAAQDVVCDGPDEVCFFREVVCHEVFPMI